MYKFLLLSVLLLVGYTSSAQYYIRGDVKDEKGQPLQNVKIYMHSSHLLYYSGASGGFGITGKLLIDSLTFNLEGFEPKSIEVRADQYQEVKLRVLTGNLSMQKPKLISITKDLEQQSYRKWYFADESYSTLIENDFIKPDKYPNTGFAVRVDKASYSNIRRFINQKSTVPTDAVRIEEMLNYFNFNYKEPPPDQVIGIESQVTDCPWNSAHKLLMLNLNARKIPLDRIPPSNFVFLIDVSGSMDMPNRLPLLKAAFQLLVKNLRAIDTVSIVIYGGAVGVWLQPTSGSEKQKITKSIEELYPSGSTPGEAAVRTAYKIAKSTFIKGGNNRIILATDGDFNVGQTTEKELEDLISSERQSGVYLTCLGVGMGNYKDSKIEALAKKGNGNFAYLDDIREAEKVLVTELTQTLYTVANDVYLNVKFNPARIKEYRLVGYDNKKNVAQDSTSELEGGEIGSGNGITSVFEITPVDKIAADSDSEIACLTLNYKVPNSEVPQTLKYNCYDNYKELKDIPKELKFATAVMMSGLLMRESKYKANAKWNDVTTIARESLNPDDYLQNEFINLIEKAKKIYSKKKKE